jgi:hypothetical protein
MEPTLIETPSLNELSAQYLSRPLTLIHSLANISFTFKQKAVYQSIYFDDQPVLQVCNCNAWHTHFDYYTLQTTLYLGNTGFHSQPKD